MQLKIILKTELQHRNVLQVSINIVETPDTNNLQKDYVTVLFTDALL